MHITISLPLPLPIPIPIPIHRTYMNSFQTTLTPHPEMLYTSYSGIKQY